MDWSNDDAAVCRIDALIAETEQRIARQRELIAGMRELNLDASDAQRTLDLMQSVLESIRHHRKAILRFSRGTIH